MGHSSGQGRRDGEGQLRECPLHPSMPAPNTSRGLSNCCLTKQPGFEGVSPSLKQGQTPPPRQVSAPWTQGWAVTRARSSPCSCRHEHLPPVPCPEPGRGKRHPRHHPTGSPSGFAHSQRAMKETCFILWVFTLSQRNRRYGAKRPRTTCQRTDTTVSR